MRDDDKVMPTPPVAPPHVRKAAADALERARQADLEQVGAARARYAADPVRRDRERLGLPLTEDDIQQAQRITRAEARALRMDESVPGGAYVNERGRLVDAYGRELD